MSDTIENIKGLYINGLYMGMFSSITPTNELSYLEDPSRDNDFSSNNESIGSAYIPKIECKLGLLTADDYSSLIKKINVPSFTCEYYDYELGRNVSRKMYASNITRGTLYHHGRDLKGLVGTSLTFVCYYGYGTYDDLMNDNRMEE